MEKREGKSNVQRKEIIGRGIVKIYYSNNPERRQFSPIIDKPFNLFVRSIDNFYDKIYPDGAFVRGPQGQKKYLHVGGIPYKIWFYTAAALAAIMLALCSFGSIKIILKILTYTTVKQEKNYVIKDELRDIIVGEYIETTIRYQDSKPINIWIEKGGEKALPDDNDIHRQWFFEDSGFSVRMERKKAVITLAFAEVGLYNLVVGFQRDKHMVFKRFNVLDWCCRLNNISTNKWVISIPNGVRKITGDAFVQDCRGARKVIIPESVTEIDVRISKYLDLCEVFEISPSNRIFSSYEGMIIKGKTELFSYPRGRKSQQVTIPKFIETINPFAFLGNPEIRRILLSNPRTRYNGSLAVDVPSRLMVDIPSDTGEYIWEKKRDKRSRGYFYGIYQ